MERLVVGHRSTTAELISASGAPALQSAWARIRHLWRYAVYLVALFSIVTAAAVIRLDVQGLRQDLDRNARATREAMILRDRLRLEMDARRRAVAMEQAAASLNMEQGVRIVRLGGDR